MKSLKKNIFCLLLCVPFLTIGQTKYLTIEPNHSTIGFKIGIAGGITKVSGKFTKSDLQLDYVDSDMTKSKVKFIIDASSIDTGIEDRDQHLKSPTFFSVDSFPEIVFTSKEIIKLNSNTYKMNGSFEMRGIKTSIDFQFVLYEDKNDLAFHIEPFEISRKEYNLGSGFVHTAIPNFLSDMVLIEIDFWTKKDKRKRSTSSD